MVNSGDLRDAGTDARASAEAISTSASNLPFTFCRFIAVTPPTSSFHLCHRIFRWRVITPSTGQFPLIHDALHFCAAGRSGVLGALAFEGSGHHLGHHKSTENLHVRGSGIPWHAEIGSPVQRVFERRVLGGRVGLRVLGEPDDNIRNSLRVNGKVYT